MREPLEYPGTNLLSYPYPLRPGVIARIALPKDLTRSEAARVQAFIATLVSESDSGAWRKA